MGTRTNQAAAQPQTKRCAVYTRKSTEEGLEQEFVTLDTQRECAEAFIQSQAAEGWQGLPDRHNDGGCSGGDTDRPALQRLLAPLTIPVKTAVFVNKSQ
jgi:site-specific DNA recombinase